MSATPAPAASASADEAHPSGDERFALLDRSLRKARYAPDQLIELLHVAQEVFGHLSEDVLLYLARALRLPPSRVYGVATFYHLFTFEAPGAHSCTVCTGTACFVKGADAIVGAVTGAFHVQPGATTADDQLSLSTARCLGSCGLAPVVVIDGVVHGHEQPDSVTSALQDALDTPLETDEAASPAREP